jgi:hypothetical protein
MFPAFVPPPSPPGGGVNGNCGFCSSAMFFSHSKSNDFQHTTSASGRLRGTAEMSAKYLHLQEVMCQRNTGNYITIGSLLGRERAVDGYQQIKGFSLDTALFSLENRAHILRLQFMWAPVEPRVL